MRKWIIYFHFIVNYVLKFINRWIYIQPRLIIVLIATLIVDDARLSNAKNLGITVIGNRELPIDHRQSPDRD